MTRAIVYVPSKDFDPHAALCSVYATEHGYDIVGIVRDDWTAVQKMLGDGEASVALVSVEEHLPPKRKPRIEVVANAVKSRWEGRTRIIRRNAAG